MNYYNEIDPYCAAWLRNLMVFGLIPYGDVDNRSIEDVLPSDLKGYTQCHFFAGLGGWSYALRLAKWPENRECWSGSAPCQPFSQAGKGAGFADERHLWPAFFHLIEQCRPAAIFGEQVASALEWLDLVQDDLEGTGYAFRAEDLCAAGVGAPQIRQRLFWVANRTRDRWQKECAESGRSIEGDKSKGRSAGFVSGSATGGLVRPHGPRPQSRKQVGEAARQGRPAVATSGTALRLGDDDDAGSQVGSVPAFEPGALRIEGSTLGSAGPLRGFWGNADWLWCRDGKYRPTQPGIFPLAYGVSARVGKLRAAGNAIVPGLAAEFIRHYAP